MKYVVFGEVIVSAVFPERLATGAKITGQITLRNPFSVQAALGCRVVAVWSGCAYEWGGIADGGTEVTLNFPADFKFREPVNAPDPTMPIGEAVLTIGAVAVSSDGTKSEEITVTIEPSYVPLGLTLFGVICSAVSMVFGALTYFKRR